MTFGGGLKRLVFFAALGLAAWTGGLLGFVQTVVSYATPPIDARLAPTQAIVVLTGGTERLAAGVELLRAGKGRKLFISGVYPGVGAGQVLSKSDVPQDLRECCVVLGHAADNTRGNADETLAFMQSEGFLSLRLVTAHYHMPRSLLLFHELLPPMIDVVPYPVDPDNVSLHDWWQRPGTASLLLMEYNKYLYARMRIMLGVI